MVNVKVIDKFTLLERAFTNLNGEDAVKPERHLGEYKKQGERQ